ncbi:hypothetical protein [Desulfosporosinus lacus]|uniref:Uncharacterized protein n=1 Tax=Desulfosporosinus lacus DSM 15449 TaxID=1121420 RepID=A0A1M5ZS83_9FIRM|nr:hypothetical protein [Desulfosporosinus lacus]SHI27120.1 hypothetical protein SAMN02746098_03618 [Desulfosporosinus lacus DSM 15449]
MKHTRIMALVMALSVLTLSACSSGTPDDDMTANAIPSPLSSATVDPITPPTSTAPPTTEPTAKPSTEPVPAPPTADPVSEENTAVQETPVSLAERPEFSPEDRVREEELISLHGYSIGMTFAETQQVWKIPKNMIDYAIGRWTPEAPNLYIYIGNMGYEFKPGPDAVADHFDNYILQHIYYGETIFCANREPLSVLRDIELGDRIEDTLKSLPGNRTPRRWTMDQLYGEYGKPNSASLEYITNLGFYELRIYCESSWIRLSYGSSGKLWIAEVFSI